MTRKTGISDQAVVKNSGGTEITDELGRIGTVSWDIQDDAERIADVNSGADYASTVDTLITMQGSLSLMAPGFRVMKLMGSETTGSGTWTISLDDTLPKHTLQAQATEEDIVEFTGVKFGSVRAEATQGDFLRLTFDWMATDFSFKNTTITGATPNDEPVTWLDGSATLNSVAMSLENATLRYDRNLQSVRGIESTTAGEKRLPSELIEQVKDLSFDASVEIEDETPFEQSHDDTSFPIEPVDSRSDKNFKLDFGGTAGSWDMTGGRVFSQSGELNEEKDVRTADLEGHARGATITGDT